MRCYVPNLQNCVFLAKFFCSPEWQLHLVSATWRSVIFREYTTEKHWKPQQGGQSMVHRANLSHLIALFRDDADGNIAIQK